MRSSYSSWRSEAITTSALLLLTVPPWVHREGNTFVFLRGFWPRQCGSFLSNSISLPPFLGFVWHVIHTSSGDVVWTLLSCRGALNFSSAAMCKVCVFLGFFFVKQFNFPNLSPTQPNWGPRAGLFMVSTFSNSSYLIMRNKNVRYCICVLNRRRVAMNQSVSH